MNDSADSTAVAVVGAGSVGIAVAYYLVKDHGVRDVVLIDPRDPMSLTSAQSGENYRNWWPHPVMTSFTDRGIALLEEIDRAADGRLNMTRGGYALVTRREAPDDLIRDLHRGYGGDGDKGARIRMRDSVHGDYQPPQRTPWQQAPDGVDVLTDRALIRKTFPTYAPDVATVIHVRRAGSFSTQQLGQYMLEQIRLRGGRLLRAEVRGIAGPAPFTLTLATDDGPRTLRADRLVNAAGPFLRDIGRMLGEELPVECVYQQKIAFQDAQRAIPRDLPFSIDLDPQSLDWSDEDRALLATEPAARHLLAPLPGGLHCRPDGAVDGTWVKLGWAYNRSASDPHAEAPVDAQFPDTVVRGASRLHPGLAAYIGRLPRSVHHYGGYYTMTPENWPLIGPMKTDGAFMAGALSGFGSMAATSAGALCAAWVAGQTVASEARMLGAQRYATPGFMAELAAFGPGAL